MRGRESTAATRSLFAFDELGFLTGCIVADKEIFPFQIFWLSDGRIEGQVAGKSPIHIDNFMFFDAKLTSELLDAFRLLMRSN